VLEFDTHTNPALAPDPHTQYLLETNAAATYIPITGGTGTNTTLHTPVINNSMRFNTSPATTDATQGAVQWNVNERTLDVSVGNDVTMNVGHELFANVMNQTGGTITNGMAVRYAGTVGASGMRKGALMVADGSVLPTYFLGVATETITNGMTGKVTTYGCVHDLATGGNPNLYGEDWSDLTNGAPIYVSTNRPGFLTRHEPQAPQRRIVAGSIDFVHGTQGFICVRPIFSQKITELDDVDGTPLSASGQIMVWDAERGVFDFTGNIRDYLLASYTNGLPQAGCTTLTADGTNLVITGQTYAYDATVTNAYQLSVSPSAQRWHYSLTVLGTNAATFATNIYLRGTQTITGTNCVGLKPFGANDWEVLWGGK
jgi:hypothetical protein